MTIDEAILSLAGLNSGKNGVACKNENDLLYLFYSYQNKKGRECNFTDEEKQRLKDIAAAIFERRRQGPRKATKSTYWKMLKEKSVQDNQRSLF